MKKKIMFTAQIIRYKNSAKDIVIIKKNVFIYNVYI